MRSFVGCAFGRRALPCKVSLDGGARSEEKTRSDAGILNSQPTLIENVPDAFLDGQDSGEGSRSPMQPIVNILIALLLVQPAGLHAAETVTNSLGMTLVRIAPGTFRMGQDGPPVSGNGDMATHHAEFRSADWDEKPAHRVVTSSPFLDPCGA